MRFGGRRARQGRRGGAQDARREGEAHALALGGEAERRDPGARARQRHRRPGGQRRRVLASQSQIGRPPMRGRRSQVCSIAAGYQDAQHSVAIGKARLAWQR